MNVTNFKKHKDWIKIWSGRWSLHFDSHQGEDWTVYNKIQGRPAFKRVIYFYENTKTDCWVSKKDKDNFGKRLASAADKNDSFVYSIARLLRTEADNFISFIEFNNPKKINKLKYDAFWKLSQAYLLQHISVKYIVDYLSSQQLKRYLPALSEARLYSEQVYRIAEDFMEKYFEIVARSNGYTKNQMLCTTSSEIQKYFNNQSLPSKKILSERAVKSAVIIEKGIVKVFSGVKVKNIEKIVHHNSTDDKIQGEVAYKGKAIGRVRVVWNPNKAMSIFKPGDILVTGMTRPEFLPLMKKAAAYITEAGGILSHAAIVARELKKPCIIGTQNATKVLKDGDEVEVDADNGIIRKI